MNEKIKELRFNPEKAQHYFQKILAYSVGPVELKTLMDEGKVRLVDARRREDYDIAHIPGAISIPQKDTANHLEELSKEEITVVYSYNSQCTLAVQSCLTLAEYSYPCMVLKGGFKVWTEDFRFATT